MKSGKFEPKRKVGKSIRSKKVKWNVDPVVESPMIAARSMENPINENFGVDAPMETVVETETLLGAFSDLKSPFI